MKKQTPEIILY